MMTPDSILPWQQQAWQHLQQYIAQNRIPQALLFIGPKGLGKQQLAQQYTAALLCSNPQDNGLACGQCQSCLLIQAETHPDVLMITPEETDKNITIAQIRSLIGKLTLKPQFDRYRVAIINPADNMNTAAANAFLKCLEEPTERTSLILITDKPNRLPATIISRCQKLHLSCPKPVTFVHWLKQHNIPHDHEVLYNLSNGAPFLALQYVTDQQIKSRQHCFSQWLALAKHQTHPIMVAEQWLAIPITTLLPWLISWVMDLIKCAYQIHPIYLRNKDLTESLQELASQLDLKGLYQLYDLLLSSQQRLRTQVNTQLMLEEILLGWSNLRRY